MGKYVERWANPMQPRIPEEEPKVEQKEEIINGPGNEMNNPVV